MAADRFEELLPDYLEGGLDAAEAGRVRDHLAGCRNCRRLLAALAGTRDALAGIGELEAPERLLGRLRAIPDGERGFSFARDFLLRPSLQPVFAAASVLLTVLSFYLFSPDRKAIDSTISRQLHHGYGQVEKLYGRAGSITDRLDAYKDDLVGSLKGLKLFGRTKRNSQG